MLVTSPRFPFIDYLYWCQKNDYFSDVPLIETIKTGLAHARKGGLIRSLIEDSGIKTNKDLVALIAEKIQQHQRSESFSDRDLMLIFDLIQGWGGKSGRNVYVLPKNNPTRVSLKNISEIYRVAVGHCISGDYRSALHKLTSIPNLGESFATKHIFFWSEYGPGRNALPIYDTRIKLLLFIKLKKALEYEVYVNSLSSMAKQLSMSMPLVERALFSFSQNYFPNGNLLIRKHPKDNTDIEEARKLQTLFLQA